MAHPNSAGTLVDVLIARSESGRWPMRIAATLFMTVLTAAAAQISVPLPFTSVPFTLQPMVVVLAGLTLGARLALASQVVYLLAGVAGLPVFAASATLPPGALRLIGPTGGYLMSYPVAAFFTGYLAQRGFDRRYLTSVFAMLTGLVVIYACGISWLAFVGRTGLQAALAAGMYPFILADLMKLAVAAAIVPGFWRLLGHAADR